MQIFANVADRAERVYVRYKISRVILSVRLVFARDILRLKCRRSVVE